MQIEASEEADLDFLLIQPIEGGELGVVSRCLPCPICAQERNGFYPLTRVAARDEQELLSSYEEAVIAICRTSMSIEPGGQDRPLRAAYEAADDEWDAMAAREEALERRLRDLGYPQSAINDLHFAIRSSEMFPSADKRRRAPDSSAVK
jgi:hypothetical protein